MPDKEWLQGTLPLSGTRGSHMFSTIFVYCTWQSTWHCTLVCSNCGCSHSICCHGFEIQSLGLSGKMLIMWTGDSQRPLRTANWVTGICAVADSIGTLQRMSQYTVSTTYFDRSRIAKLLCDMEHFCTVVCAFVLSIWSKKGRKTHTIKSVRLYIIYNNYCTGRLHISDMLPNWGRLQHTG